MSAICLKCGRAVYHAEEMLAGGLKWHKTCFKCELCHKRLELGGANAHDDALWCKQCYARRFGPKGYGFGVGAGALGMDLGEHLGNTDCEMSNKPLGVNN